MKAEVTVRGLSLWSVYPHLCFTDEDIFPPRRCPLVSHSCQVTESVFKLKFPRTPETGRVILLLKQNL